MQKFLIYGWGGSQECPNCGACKESVEHTLCSVYMCSLYDSQLQIFLDYWRHVLPLDALEASLCGGIGNKAVFCLAPVGLRKELVEHVYFQWIACDPQRQIFGLFGVSSSFRCI